MFLIIWQEKLKYNKQRMSHQAPHLPALMSVADLTNQSQTSFLLDSRLQYPPHSTQATAASKTEQAQSITLPAQPALELHSFLEGITPFPGQLNRLEPTLHP